MPAVATQLGLGGGGYLGDAGGAYPPTILKCNFCTAPKAKNGQPTVKCRDYLIFEMQQNHIFPVASPLTPLGELTALPQTLS